MRDCKKCPLDVFCQEVKRQYHTSPPWEEAVEALTLILKEFPDLELVGDYKCPLEESETLVLILKAFPDLEPVVLQYLKSRD